MHSKIIFNLECDWISYTMKIDFMKVSNMILWGGAVTSL